MLRWVHSFTRSLTHLKCEFWYPRIRQFFTTVESRGTIYLQHQRSCDAPSCSRSEMWNCGSLLLLNICLFIVLHSRARLSAFSALHFISDLDRFRAALTKQLIAHGFTIWSFHCLNVQFQHQLFEGEVVMMRVDEWGGSWAWGLTSKLVKKSKYKYHLWT